MKVKRPTSDDKHAATVTRTKTADGGEPPARDGELMTDARRQWLDRHPDPDERPEWCEMCDRPVSVTDRDNQHTKIERLSHEARQAWRPPLDNHEWAEWSTAGGWPRKVSTKYRYGPVVTA